MFEVVPIGIFCMIMVMELFSFMSRSFAHFLLHLESNILYALQVSLENGTVQGFDIRTTASDSSSGPKPCFTLHAHDKAVSSISYNPSAPNVCS